MSVASERFSMRDNSIAGYSQLKGRNETGNRSLGFASNSTFNLAENSHGGTKTQREKQIAGGGWHWLSERRENLLSARTATASGASVQLFFA